MAGGTGAIVGITIGSVITAVLVLALLIYMFKLWLRGPTLGSDQRKRLDGKVVAITGKSIFFGLGLVNSSYIHN